MSRIWILEDEPSCQFVYQDILPTEHEPRFFSSLQAFEEAWAAGTLPDLVISDLRMGDGSFLNVLREKTKYPKLHGMPLLVVSVIDDYDVLKECFEKGACDYLTKPFNKSELLFKVNRLLEAPERRQNMVDLHPSRMCATLGTKTSEELTSKEYQILSLFLSSSDHKLGRDEIYKEVWNEVNVSSKTLEVHLSNLRKKLAPLGINVHYQAPYYILSLPAAA